jgi:cytochrome c5
VFLSFLVPILIIILLTRFVSFGDKTGAGSSAMDPESVATRIQAVGSLELKAGGAGALRGGEEVFKGQCAACHVSGALGSPKLGDTAAWGPRLGQGFDKLVASALKGKGSMAPQGGGEFNDTEIARAVAYMANQAGGKFEEPKAPAAAAQ